MNRTIIEKKGDAADYDAQNDSFFVYSKEAKYKSSIDLDDIILDIDEDNSIMGVEILDISAKFGISKYDVQNYRRLDVTIEITEKIIDVQLTLSFLKRNAEVSRVTEASAINSMNLPVGSESLAIVA